MNYTRYVTYKFLVELLLTTALYALGQKPRKRFGLRIALSLGGCFLLAYAISPITTGYYHWEDAPRLTATVLRFLMLYAAATLSLFACFQLNIRAAIYLSAGAYAVQHIVTILYNLLESLYRGILPLWIMTVIYIVFILGCYAAFYFLLLRRLHRTDALLLRANETLLLNVLSIAALIVLSVLAGADGEVSLPVRIAHDGYGIISGVFLLCMQLDLFAKSTLRGENERIEYILAQERRQFESFRAGVSYLDIKCHDLKHQIHRLKDGKAISDAVLAELEDGVRRYEAYANTGNAALDIVIAEKFLECANNAIEFVPAVKSDKMSLLSEADLYSLFGNALDNAIEYERTMPKEQRFIRLGVNELAGMLMIRIENGYAGEPISDAAVLQTTKADKTSHGFGLKSMRRIAEKYGGEMDVETKDGVFALTFAFPLSG